MLENEDQETQAAAILPRGFALVVTDTHKGRTRLARSLHHVLVAHIGAGISGYGLPNVPGRKGLMVYRTEQGKAAGEKTFNRIISRDVHANGTVQGGTDMPKPMTKNGIDTHLQMILLDNISRYGIIGLAGPDLVSEINLKDASEKSLACGYLAQMADMAETTIVTRMTGEDIDEHLNGRIWGVPELIYTKWSAHILPTEEEDIHQIRIASNSRVYVQILLKETEKGFKTPYSS